MRHKTHLKITKKTMRCKQELKNFIDHYGLEETREALEQLEEEMNDVCAVCDEPEDDDGRCGCTNEDAN